MVCGPGQIPVTNVTARCGKDLAAVAAGKRIFNFLINKLQKE
jgi:hypothetical protein